MKSIAETPGSFSSLLGLRMLKEENSSQTRLKALIQSLEWTYGVLWKLSSGERPVLEWAHGWFNSTSLEFGPTLAPQFYSIFKNCSFKDPGSQGYAAFALQRDCGPLWWTSSMPQIPTDKCKAQFLQTIVCIPGLGGDGVRYCTELATTSLVPQMDSLMNSLQDYVSMSVTPQMFGTVSRPPSSDLDSTSGQGYPHLHSGTSVAQMMAPEGLPLPGPAQAFLPPLNLHRYTPGDFNESLASSGAILRSEEPYFQWTALGNQSLFFNDHELQSGFFDDLDIDVGVDKTLFSPLDCKAETKAASSNVDVLNPYTWDSNAFDPEEVVRQAAAGLPEYYSPPSPLQHSTHVNSASSLPPAQIAELSSAKSLDSIPSLGTVQSLQADLHSSSFSHLLEPSRSFGTHEASVTKTEQTTSNTDAFQLRQTTQCEGFTQNPAAWPSAYQGSNLTMDVLDNELASWPASHFRHNQESLFQKRECKPNLRTCVGDDHASPRQSLFRRWTEKIVPIIQEEAERQKLAEQQLAKSKLNPADNMKSSNPAHDEAAHIHKLAERHRRSKFNEKLHTIFTLVPVIKKKDRVSILSHTIDYIRQLKAEVAQLQEKCASSVLGHQQGGTTTTIDKVQPPANVTTSKHAPKEEEDFEGGLRFGSMMDLLKVAVYPDNEDGMVIKVDTNNNQTQMLIQILTTSRDLGLEVRWFNSKFVDNRMHVTLTATAQGEHEMMSCEQVQEALQQVLVRFDSSPSSTITSGV
ncbi:unnamed protein product [Sphagnum compactum]